MRLIHCVFEFVSCEANVRRVSRFPQVSRCFCISQVEFLTGESVAQQAGQLDCSPHAATHSGKLRRRDNCYSSRIASSSLGNGSDRRCASLTTLLLILFAVWAGFAQSDSSNRRLLTQPHLACKRFASIDFSTHFELLSCRLCLLSSTFVVFRRSGRSFG